MQSEAASIDAYLDARPSERRAPLQRLRDRCRSRLDGFQEAIEYDMPAYRRDGVVEIAFASQKQYLALSVVKQPVLDRHRDALAGLDVGKSCIRYRRPTQIDLAVVEAMLVETRDSRGAPV